MHRAYIEDEALDIDPWVRQRVYRRQSRSRPTNIATSSPGASVAMAAFADWMRGRDALFTPTLADHSDAAR